MEDTFAAIIIIIGLIITSTLVYRGFFKAVTDKNRLVWFDLREKRLACDYDGEKPHLPDINLKVRLKNGFQYQDLIMDFEKLQVVPLHRNPKFLRSCCQMINEEWQRSETARMMSLQASCDELPISLILIDDKNNLFGHCKLSRIPSIPESCFVETVVISKEMRGKKLGSFLMRQVEKHCKDILKLKMIHLSTKGQENFYTKLGYEICSPISIYGVIKSLSEVKSKEVTNKIQNQVPNRIGLPPPPPPPMPKPDFNNQITRKTYMMKYL